MLGCRAEIFFLLILFSFYRRVVALRPKLFLLWPGTGWSEETVNCSFSMTDTLYLAVLLSYVMIHLDTRVVVVVLLCYMIHIGSGGLRPLVHLSCIISLHRPGRVTRWLEATWLGNQNTAVTRVLKTDAEWLTLLWASIQHVQVLSVDKFLDKESIGLTMCNGHISSAHATFKVSYTVSFWVAGCLNFAGADVLSEEVKTLALDAVS